MTEPVQPEPVAPGGGIDLAKILDTLVPPTSVEVRDIGGNVYKLQAALPARRQIVVLRSVEQLTRLAANDQDVARILSGMQSFGSGSGGETIAAIAAAAIALAANDQILVLLGEAFEAAHPETVKAAGKALGAEHAIDLFGVEEIVAGILPFFVMIAKRAGSAILTVSAAIPAETTPTA